MPQPLLELRDVSCERDDAPLFEPISFALAPGDIVQLEGANGIGKTSLLRCIGGLSTRWRGQMAWRGEPLLRQRAEFAAATLYLGHIIGLKAALNARENLQWWASMRGIDTLKGTGAHAALDSALDRVGLCGYEDSPCYQLSAGQQRRVALARLFLSSAPLWILDEPFTAIDRRGVAELESWLAAHADAGGAILLTTHQTLSLTRNVRSVVLQNARAENGSGA